MTALGLVLALGVTLDPRVRGDDGSLLTCITDQRLDPRVRGDDGSAPSPRVGEAGARYFAWCTPTDKELDPRVRGDDGHKCV
jgi:hypothetical protein